MSTEGFKVTFHPEAEKSLNSLAEEVLRSLRPMDEQAVRRQGRESSASIMPVVTVDYSEVRDLRLALVREDLFGKTTSFYVDMPTGRVGLSEQDYVNFERLVQTTISRPELRDVMSEKFVASTLTDWLKDRHSGVLQESTGFVEFLGQAASREVASWRIDIPIEYLVIEKPFALGDVTLHFYDRSFWDDLERKFRAAKGDATAEQLLAPLRRDFQGRVVASYEIEGDLQKCIEAAALRTELAITVLQFYSPAAFLSPLTARFGQKGKTRMPSVIAWGWSGERWTIKSSLDDPRSPYWSLSQRDLERLKHIGLEQASDLIRTKKRSPFEETLLTAITTFGRGTASPDFHDKLVFFLSAAETLLLSETSEPIQATLGLRLAFLSANQPDSRDEVDRLVREAYRIRSNYLHHGRKQEDYDMLTKLQWAIWDALRTALVNKNRFVSSEDFNRFIRTLILS